MEAACKWCVGLRRDEVCQVKSSKLFLILELRVVRVPLAWRDTAGVPCRSSTSWDDDGGRS